MLDLRKIRRTLSRLVLFLLVSVLAGALSVLALASPVVLATALVDDATNGFNDLPSALTAPALPQTSTMVAADGTRIASFYAENRTVVTLSRMSPSSEDRGQGIGARGAMAVADQGRRREAANPGRDRIPRVATARTATAR